MSEILRKKIGNWNIEVRETDHEIEILEERISGLNEQLNALSCSFNPLILSSKISISWSVSLTSMFQLPIFFLNISDIVEKIEMSKRSSTNILLSFDFNCNWNQKKGEY